MNHLYRNKYGEGHSSERPLHMRWHLLMLLLSALLLSTSTFAQTCPDLNCTSNDVTVQRVYLADESGTPLTSACTPGNPVQAYLYLVVSTNTPRIGTYISGTLKIEGMQDQMVSNCFGVQLTGNSNVLKYPTPVNWTCGSQIMLTDIFVAWGTGNTNFCATDPTCSSIVPSKCRREPPIVVEAPLIAKFTAQTSCAAENQYQTVSVTSTTTGGKMPYTYAWDFNNDGVTDATSQTATYTYMSAGDKTVKLTVTDASNPARTDVHTSTVTIGTCCTTPDANAGSDKELTCSAQTVQLSGSSATAGATYMWVASNGGHIVSGESTLMPTVDAAGTYTLTVTTAVGGCTATDEVEVTLNNTAPTATIAYTMPAEITCERASVTLQGTSNVNNAMYSWTGPGGFASDMQTIEASAVGTYMLTVTNPANGCTATDQVEIKENKTAPNANAGGDKMLTCSTTSLMLEGSTTNALQGVSITWMASNGGNIVSGGNTLTPTVDAAGTYTLKVKDLANGCESMDVVEVTLNNTAPVAQITTVSVPHLTCDVTSVMLGSLAVEGATYSWAGPGGFTAETQGITVSVAGIYVLTVTNTANGCTATDEITVTEDKDVKLSAGPGKLLNCNITEVMLEGSTEVPPHWAVVSWTASNGGHIVSGENTLTPIVDAAGTYTLKVVNARSGCEATAMVTVTQDISTPNATATGGTLSCVTGAVQLRGSSSTAGVTYHWAGPDGFASEEQNPTVMVAGTYTLTVTKTGNGCAAMAYATVNPQPTPEPVVTCHHEDFQNEAKGLVSVLNTPAGAVSVFGHKRNPDGTYAPENHAAIFNSQAPTGDDADLYTVDWGHILIINQDLTDVPNDNQWGGELMLDFSQIGPVTMTSMRALDIDGYENNSWVYLYGANDQELYKVKLQALGNNSRQVVDLGNTKGVMKMKMVLDGRNEMLHFAGSGAFDDIKFCIETPGESPCNEVLMASAESSKAVAYPMPFGDRTTLEFTFVKGGDFVANLYDLKGNLLQELKKGNAQAGQVTNVDVDGSKLMNGIYIARIMSGNEVKTVKLIVRK